MAECIVERTETGFAGVTAADDRRWRKWSAWMKSMEIGATAKFSFKIPRSPRFHKFHFAILGCLFSNQEQFQDPERFREWVQIGAGFCDLLPGPKGTPVAVSKSIAWENLEEADFAEHHEEVIKFVRTRYFTRFIWPQMEDKAAADAVEGLLSEFSL